MKKYKITLLVLASFIFVIGTYANADDEDKKNQADLVNWTEERITQWEDSVKKALYPDLKIEKLESYQENSPAAESKIAGPFSNPYIPNSHTIDKNKAIGEIPVSSGISPTGAVTYNVPIEIYPGIRGFQPQLSLVYNNQSGNGVVGIGWNIGGLSLITRTGSSIHYDGKSQGVRMTKEDAFALDGMRLIKLSETASQIKYETEQGFTKVNATLNGEVIVYFEVLYPNGCKGIFGYVGNNSNTLDYPITTLRDVQGNQINYAYTFADNHYTVSKITYGGDANTSIEFQYSSRQDPTLSYTGGINVTENQLLQKITCKFGTSAFRTYDLSYQMKRNCSTLTLIGCSAAGSSFNPLMFYYGENNTASSYTQKQTQLIQWYSGALPGQLKICKGKFDYGTENDGLITTVTRNPYWNHYLHSTGIRHSQNRYENEYDDRNESIFLYAGLSGTFADAMPNLKTENGFVDIFCANVDGKYEEEVIKVNNNISEGYDRVDFKVYASNVYYGMSYAYTRTFNFPTVLTDADKGQSIHPKFYYSGDFNGDGKMEILAVSNHNPIGNTGISSTCYLFDLNSNTKLFEGYVFPYHVDFLGSRQTDHRITTQNTDRLFPFDYDSDGKTDICLINDQGTHVYTFDISGSAYSMRKVSSYLGLNKADLNGKELLLGEFNGDGKVDFLLSPNTDASNWFIFNAMGNGQFQKIPVSITSKKSSDTHYYLLQDINSDGLSDLIEQSPFESTNYPIGYTTYLAGSRNNFYNEGFTSLNSINFIMVPTNINSRNHFHQLIALKDGIVTAFSFSRNDTKEKLLTGAVNSQGLVSKNYYRMLNESPGVSYTEGFGAVYPYENYQGPLFTPVHTEQYFNGNLRESSSINYNNAVIHKQGLGFRGFEKITTTDNIRYRSSTQTFDPYNYGIPKSDDSPTTQNSYDYSVNVQANKTVRILLNNVTSTDKLKGTKTLSSYQYDTYGNPTRETVDYGEGITTTTTNAYTNNTDEAGYRIGLLFDKTVSANRGGALWSQRTYIPSFYQAQPNAIENYVNGRAVAKEIFSYDSQGNILTKALYNYSSPIELKTGYEYDSYGRMTKETDPLGFSSYYQYNASDGRLAITKNHKQQSTSYIYDDLGRITSVNYPDGTSRKSKMEWYDNVSATEFPAVQQDQDRLLSQPMSQGGEMKACKSFTLKPGFSFGASSGNYLGLKVDANVCASPPQYGGTSLAYMITEEITGKPLVKTYHDGLGRETRKSHQRFDGIYMNQDTQYDTWGRVSQKSNPFRNGSSPSWDVYSYDEHGRIKDLSYASGKADTYTYNAQTLTSVIDGITTSKQYDAAGLVSRVTDAAGTISYNYRPDGQPSSVTATGGVVTSFEYDEYGRRTKIVDPSAGTQSFSYDAAGNILTETDANQKVTSYTYDSYNKMKSRTVPEFTTGYDYNPDGLLSSETSNNGTSKSFIYDEFGRIAREKESVVDNKWLQQDYSYTNGKVSSILYAAQSGNITTENYVYANGHLVEIKLNNQTSIWKLNAENALGLPSSVGTGCINRTYSYDSYGLPTGRTAGSIQNQEYGFSPVSGNLTYRRDKRTGIQENFTYDNLNRLTAYAQLTTSYDIKGNITQKSDAGSFIYETPGKPYAISRVNTTGNAIPLRNQSISYNSFKRPNTMTEGNYQASFVYNTGGDRVKMELKKNGSSELRRYSLGTCYELDEGLAGTKEKLYLGGDYYSAAAVYVKQGTGDWQVHYICRDYLGSITHITNSSGLVIQELSYDAWGRLRNPATQVAFTPNTEPELFLGRGYTGHEHLTMFGLVNMNARLYDPALGRFLSPDPYVQAPDMTQNFNRYSYCLNNPLRYTDENGEFWGTFLNLTKDLFVNTIIKPWTQGFNAWSDKDNWSSTYLAWKTDIGMYSSDANKNFGGKAWELVSRYTWQLPQTVAGYAYVTGANIFGQVNNVTRGYGMTAVDMGLDGGAVTIGNLTVGPSGYKADWKDHLFVHEYGHYIQSQQWGLAYLLAVGIPSIQSAMMAGNDDYPDHGTRWFEADASHKGMKYFDKYYGSKAASYTQGSPDYFDRNSFQGGTRSPYVNPRTGVENFRKHTTTSHFHWTDITIHIPFIGFIYF